MRTSNEVIQLIKKLREDKSLSLDELAKRVGVAKSTLSRYENGQREFPINDVGLYADVLGTTINHLLGIEPTQIVSKKIPLIGTICAGDGLLAEENIEDYIHYPLQNKRQPDFALVVKGQSMQGAGIDDGDIVYMRSARWTEYNGQIAAVIVNDSEHGSLKRIRWSEDTPQIKLIPENDNYAAQEFYPNEITVCGLYMGHFKVEKENK